MRDLRKVLESSGIQATPQRVAIAEVVLDSDRHPSADQVLEKVFENGTNVSRATVFNTLNTFVEHGLCRALVLTEGHVVYDPKMERHHHLVDEGDHRRRQTSRAELSATPREGTNASLHGMRMRIHARNRA